MGLSRDGVRFVLYARRLGVDFSRMATLGRQDLELGRGALARELADFGHRLPQEEIARIHGPYADELFRWLGARELHTYDNSSYEGATHIHDLNLPITESAQGAYSVVLDGGSLEHVFDFPRAIRNCMEMLAVGGHYLAITPANNFMGHGFYQFSPELYYSVLAPQNGFEVVRMIAFEDRWRAPWYAVPSPREVGGPVTLMNRRPVLLLVLAKRTAEASIFASPPQQSDYVAAWSRGKPRLPRPLARWLWKTFRRPSGFSRRLFRPLDPTR